MFPTDFRFKNHVFLQPLTCVYVAETRNSVISFLLRAETWRYGPVTWLVFPGFRPFPLPLLRILNTSKKFHICRKKGFPVGIFLNSYMKLTFEYFSRLTYMQWRLIHYISHKLKTRAFFHHTNKSLTTSAVVIEVLVGNVNIVFCFFVPVFFLTFTLFYYSFLKSWLFGSLDLSLTVYKLLLAT